MNARNSMDMINAKVALRIIIYYFFLKLFRFEYWNGAIPCFLHSADGFIINFCCSSNNSQSQRIFL